MFVSNTESDTLMCAQLWGWALVSHNQTLELPSWYIWANFVFPLKITLPSKSWEEHTWLSNLVVLKFWLRKIPMSRLQSIPYQWNQNVWDPIFFLNPSWLMLYHIPVWFSLPSKFQIFFPFLSQNWLSKSISLPLLIARTVATLFGN